MVETLRDALEREHHEIDAGIEAFTSGAVTGEAAIGPLTRAMYALRRHIYLEEVFLFPPLRDAGLVMPIMVMLREHGELWRTLDQIDADLGHDPTGASAGEHCQHLLDQLAAHNQKEEPIIYPQADSVLSAEASSELRAFLDDGHLPDQWVAERAS
jgi:hemerythrin-like domain-containing protein